MASSASSSTDIEPSSVSPTNVESCTSTEPEPESSTNGEENFDNVNMVLEKVSRDNLEVELGIVSTDALDIESGMVPGLQSQWWMILRLAFQSLGVVYGDLGTSPLYVLPSTFQNGIKDIDDIVGVVSIIFYTITLIPLINYVFIVLHATDNGNGGTFALYSLICRHAKVGMLPNQQAHDFSVSKPGNDSTSMVIGDGILTPCISVLSAVAGIRLSTSSLSEDEIMWISVAVLVCLFAYQRAGTAIVGYTFAPIMCLWFVMIAGIGIYDIVIYYPMVIKAVNPIYILSYFRRNGKDAWISLAGTVLSITGAEALFAAVGHFSIPAVQLCTCAVVYPAIVLQYFGQAAVLHLHPEFATDAFYKSVPGPLYWPMFVVSVMAAVIASQALISAAFSIVHQLVTMGCFPQVRVVHTSTKNEGQVYLPKINFLLMLACVGVTLGFKTAENLGNAYGSAVVFVINLTTVFMVLVMILIWRTNLWLVVSYVFTIGLVQFVYLTAVMSKFTEGGYVPSVFSFFLVTVMYAWNQVMSYLLL